MLYPWEGINSIRFKLALGVFLIASPLIALLHYYNFYAVSVVHNQVSISNRNMISLYMHQIDTGLNTVDQYLLSLATSNYDVRIVDAPPSDDEYMLAKVRLNGQLTTDLLMYKTVANSMFVYSVKRDDFTDAISQVNDTEYTKVTEYMRNVLLAYPPITEIGNGWFVRDIEGGHYLFRLFRTGDAWTGAWVNLSTLKNPLSYIHLGPNGASLFLDDRNKPLTEEAYLDENDIALRTPNQETELIGPDENFLIVREHSAKGNFSLAAIIPTSTVVQNLPYLNRIVIYISIIGILLFPVFFFFLRRVVLLPLNRLLTAMKRIGDGYVQTRIDPIRTSNEFMLVHATFNRMMEQMEELKIHVYEEQLNKQKAELQHLQLQMNPHFFMNTLNLIYSLALDKDYELIKEMTLRLVRYFRYMFRSNLTFVPLKDELAHVRNYIGIHELRYQRKLVCQIDVPDRMHQVPVPPLIIQLFVENTLKHAYAEMEEVPVLEVQVRIEESATASYMIITVRDEGIGFRDDVLHLLNAGERIVDEQGEHIGVWNIWHRLRLLYGDKASITFSNTVPRGAVVQLKLPLHMIE
nr:histidine kinase [Cohnella mopanensis]